MRTHIIGVCGSAMAPVAGLLQELGHTVSGSDVRFDPPMGPALQASGVRLLEGFSASHITPDLELVVVGNVCRADNPEVLEAIAQKKPLHHLATVLSRFVMHGASPLVVAGTHGKTTTTALAMWILEHASLSPGFLVGGLPKNFSSNFRLPSRTRVLQTSGAERLRRPPFVIEGDEYDTAFFEKTPKFWHYGAEVAVVTSIEHDHLDIYPTMDSYQQAFKTFLSQMPDTGVVVASMHDAALTQLVREHARSEVIWYGLGSDAPPAGAPPHWMAEPAGEDASGQSFDLFVGGVHAGRGVLPLSGSHNLRNAIGAMAAACHGYGVRLPDALEALRTFKGVARRQDVLFVVNGITVYDDFAHHPTAVFETLSGLKRRHHPARLWALFEPRSATACRRLHQAEYPAAFRAADRVLLAPLGRTNIPLEEQLDRAAVCATIGAHAHAASSVDEILTTIQNEARPGDVIVLLSNGTFGGLGERLRRTLQESA